MVVLSRCSTHTPDSELVPNWDKAKRKIYAVDEFFSFNVYSGWTEARSLGCRCSCCTITSLLNYKLEETHLVPS
jgi:hypothetical protein